MSSVVIAEKVGEPSLSLSPSLNHVFAEALTLSMATKPEVSAGAFTLGLCVNQ